MKSLYNYFSDFGLRSDVKETLLTAILVLLLSSGFVSAIMQLGA